MAGAKDKKTGLLTRNIFLRLALNSGHVFQARFEIPPGNSHFDQSREPKLRHRIRVSSNRPGTRGWKNGDGGQARSGTEVGGEKGGGRAGCRKRETQGSRTGLQARPPSQWRFAAVQPLLLSARTFLLLPDGARTPRHSHRSRQTPLTGQGLGTIAQRLLRPPSQSGPQPPGGRPCPPPPRPGPARAGLTLSARWWTRPRPGSASSCSSPSSGSSRRPATSRGQWELAGATGAGAAMFVPASPAASSPAHFRG